MTRIRTTLIEVIVLLAIGAGLAFAGNAVRSSKSLQLSRNYFDRGTERVNEMLRQRMQDRAGTVSAAAGTPSESETGEHPGPSAEFAFADLAQPDAKPKTTDSDDGSGPAGSEPSVAARPAPVEAAAPAPATASKKIEHPYQEIDFEGVVEAISDPKYAQGLYVLVDARAMDEYEQGHIPGAIQADHYELENYIGILSQRALPADKVIVYCNGGDCEDSAYMCRDLLELGMEYDRLYLYAGGWHEWEARADSSLIATGSGG
ncbi:MAG: rhodanese-like domain-containing protein [Phycisphaerae bacterium]|nr:rhodanese-like domain-containing protein [Phycisphaerae bacterium]